jgi:hypothetical protein
MQPSSVRLTDFLAAFFPIDGEIIYLRAFAPKKAPSNDPRFTTRQFTVTRDGLVADKTLQGQLCRLNLTRGLYFVVNTGGKSDAEITRFNAWFAEDDTLPIDEQHRVLDAAPLGPSIRIETLKSVHAYWLIAGDCDAKGWRDIQQRLIAYFGGDEKIKNPSRVMRLPFFNHVKFNEQDGSLSYKQVELATFHPERKYTLAEMQNAFPPVELTQKIFNSRDLPDLLTWDDLNTELKRRIMEAGKQNQKGIYEMRGVCHGGKGETALCFDPATGIVWCNNGCSKTSIRLAFDLPESPYGKAKEGKEKLPPRFALTRLDDLLAEPQEEVSFVWDKTLPCGGYSICGAKPKVGKSTLARNLAVAVARGESFFWRATHKGAVIYLCLEEKRAEVAEHFRRMGAHGCDIHIFTGRTPDDAITALKEAIHEINPGLVIVDPLARFVRVRDFNDYAEISRGMEPLIDLARSTGCHILSVHHCGKGERDGGDALLGSTALFGAVDTLLIMKRHEGARTLQTVQRYGEDLPETVAHLDAETGIVTAGGDMKTLQVDARKTAVLDSLGDERLTEQDIRERVGGNQTLTAKAIRALYERGDLQRTGAGKRGDPYLYYKAGSTSENLLMESPILDSVDMVNRENLENHESREDEIEPEWLADLAESDWMKGEPDEIRERAAIMEIDGLVPCAEAEWLARTEFMQTAA